MSKSLDNHIELASTDDDTRARVKTAFTDPQRLRRSDPGRPWVCNVYSLHKYFNSDRLDELYSMCVNAEMGCVEDKSILAEGINRSLESFRERRMELDSKKGYVTDLLADGADKARAIARETLSEVKDRLHISEVML